MSRDYDYHRVYDHDDQLKTGDQFRIQHRVEFMDWSAKKAHLDGLITKPMKELEAMRKESAGKETEIYKRLLSETAEWENQAAQTLLLDKAMEYLRNPQVEHTGNQWKEVEPGKWEISNRVYIMTYTIAQDVAGDVWRVSWNVDYNPPPQPERKYFSGWGSSLHIAEQKNKRYPSLEAAQNYIQSRFDLYTHLFLEVNPPIPQDAKWMFTMYAHLLPGYTLEPSGPDKDAVDALLSCLEDEDAAGLGAEQEAAAPPAPEQEAAAPKAEKKNPLNAPPGQTPRPSSKKKQAPAQAKKSGPVR